MLHSEDKCNHMKEDKTSIHEDVRTLPSGCLLPPFEPLCNK